MTATVSDPTTTGEPVANAPTAHVLTAIRAVMADVRGVAKAGEMRSSTAVNAKVQYKFQKYDDLAEAIGAAFREHGIMTAGRIVDISYHNWDKQNANGGTTLWTSCRLRKIFLFTSLVDGTHLSMEGAGEGSDSSDKATNKAETSAYKNALKQAFTLSTGETDPDAERPEVTGENVQVRNAQVRQDDPWAQLENTVSQNPVGEPADEDRTEKARKALDAIARCRTTGDALRLTQWALEANVLTVAIGGTSVGARILAARSTLPQGPPSSVAHQTQAPPQEYQPSRSEIHHAAMDLPRGNTPPDDGGY